MTLTGEPFLGLIYCGRVYANRASNDSAPYRIGWTFADEVVGCHFVVLMAFHIAACG
jgi:hypothetical protein